MKKVILLVLISIFVTVISTGLVLAGDIKEISGSGRAILGNGITLEQAEEISLMMAKRNAIDKFGIFIESETVVRNYSVAKDEVTAISAGIVKLLPKFKKIEKVIEDNNILIETTAKFGIDVDKFEETINKYVEERASSKDIEKLVERVKSLESKLETISQDSNLSYKEADLQISKINNSYKDLNNALLFSGNKIFASINDERIKRLNRIVEYLEMLKTVADPYKLITPSIIDKPNIKDLGEGKIGISIKTRVKLNEQYYKKAVKIAEEYKDEIYPNGKVDNINREILSDQGSWYCPLIIALLNTNQEIVAFYYNASINMNFYLHHESISNYNARKASFMSIPRFGIPWDYIEQTTEWYRELPEDIVKEINSIELLYSNYISRDFIDLNYEKYYTGWDSANGVSLESYIYTITPISLSEVKLNKEDIDDLLNSSINKAKKKIKELQEQNMNNSNNENNSNNVGFSYGG